MTFLRLKGIPVPEIYGYSATADNPAQAEYMFLEYGPGGNLGALWGGMNGCLVFVFQLVAVSTSFEI
jgi:hypothetical protein